MVHHRYFPPSGRHSPMIDRRAVVLPAPLGPNRAVNRPPETSKSKLLSATVWRNRLVTALKTMTLIDPHFTGSGRQKFDTSATQRRQAVAPLLFSTRLQRSREPQLGSDLASSV